MKIIILSAGQGRRLLPLTERSPKCAVPVNGTPMLEWQLREISKCDVNAVTVLTGFCADDVDSIVQRMQPELPDQHLTCLHNPFYAVTDNLGTCWVATREMDEPFVIINGDTLFEAPILQRLLSSPSNAPITLVTDRKGDYDADDMKVITVDGQLRRVGKHLSDGVNGESIGMMVFRNKGPALFKDKVETIMRKEEGTKRWYLSAIDELAQQGHVNICDIAGLSWCEVDDPSDLVHAQQVLSTWRQTSAIS